MEQPSPLCLGREQGQLQSGEGPEEPQSSLVGKAMRCAFIQRWSTRPVTYPDSPSWNQGRARVPLLPSVRQGGGQTGEGMMGTGREDGAVVSPLKPDSLGSNPSPAGD